MLTGGGDPPWEWTELLLCRDVYHCTPSQLAAEDVDTVMAHIAMLSAEARALKFQLDKPKGKSGGRKNR